MLMVAAGTFILVTGESPTPAVVAAYLHAFSLVLGGLNAAFMTAMNWLLASHERRGDSASPPTIGNSCGRTLVGLSVIAEGACVVAMVRRFGGRPEERSRIVKQKILVVVQEYPQVSETYIKNEVDALAELTISNPRARGRGATRIGRDGRTSC